MTQEGKMHGNSFSGSPLRRKKKGQLFKAEYEASSRTSSSSSLDALRGSDDRTAESPREKRNSESTATSTEHAANLSSKLSPTQDLPSTRQPFANVSALQPTFVATNFNDKNQNFYDTDDANNDSVDANSTSNIIDLSEARIVNARNIWGNVSKSNHSKSGSGSRKRTQARRLSRGSVSNSIRSMGSQTRSRSSHGSISIHTMASSMNSGTDSDLDYEILSETDNEDNYQQDQESITDSDSDSQESISQYDALWREKRLYDDKSRISRKVGTPPSLSSSAVTQEPHLNTSGQSEHAESVAIASSNPPVAEPSTGALSPVPASPTKELRFASLPGQQAQTNSPGQGAPFSKTSLKENGNTKDNNIKVGGILRNSYKVSKNDPSKSDKQKQGKISGARNKYSYGKTGRNSAPSKQVLWAEELKEEYSHRSEGRIQNEMYQDYAMPLKKIPSNSLKRHSADAFFEILKDAEEAANNSKSNRRGSISSESLNTLNSSNRQDSLSDVFDIESSVVSHSQRNPSFNASFTSQASSNLIDSDRDTRILELTASSLSTHQESIEVSLSGDKKTAVDWETVNKRLQSRRENDVVAMERGTGQRYSFSETEPELSEDFYDPFFAPREERKSGSSLGDLDIPKPHQKSGKRESGDKGTDKAPNPSNHSNFLEYSFSQHFGEQEPKPPAKAEKSNLPSSVRMQCHMVRRVFAFLIVLASILLIYFFIRPVRLDEDEPMGIDPLFMVDP